MQCVQSQGINLKPPGLAWPDAAVRAFVDIVRLVVICRYMTGEVQKKKENAGVNTE